MLNLQHYYFPQNVLSKIKNSKTLIWIKNINFKTDSKSVHIGKKPSTYLINKQIDEDEVRTNFLQLRVSLSL